MLRALEKHRWYMEKVAATLGISTSTLYRLRMKYRIMGP
ncbi:MAG: helix-turn-helix domain-containing protein [Polyangiaceae bacterium]